jgi:CubicO group peptidase (beta-lactamase class C family)
MTSTHPDGLIDLRRAATRILQRHHVPGLSLAVTSSHGLLHAEGFGCADLATARPVTPATGFPWFSMSKIVTATAALRLADDGELDLNAPVASVIPSYRRASSRRTPLIRDLLNHTAGAANPLPLRWVHPAHQPPDTADAAVARLLRTTRPRTRTTGQARYSNLGYLLLGEVIARTAGEPFQQYVRRAVLEPAGMQATGYDYQPGLDYATGYIRLPHPATPLLRAALPPGTVGTRHHKHVALNRFRVNGAAYGGLIGHVLDAAKILQLHLGNGTIHGVRILQPDTARRMRNIQTPGKPFDVGLGWFRRPADRDAHPSFVEHWGTGGGYWNAMRLYPDVNLGIVLMANTTHRYNHQSLIDAALTAYTSQQPDLARQKTRP